MFFAMSAGAYMKLLIFCLEEKQILFGQLTAVEARVVSLSPAFFFLLVCFCFLQVIHIFIRNKALHLNLLSSVILGLHFFPLLFFFFKVSSDLKL